MPAETFISLGEAAGNAVEKIRGVADAQFVELIQAIMANADYAAKRASENIRAAQLAEGKVAEHLLASSIRYTQVSAGFYRQACDEILNYQRRNQS